MTKITILVSLFLLGAILCQSTQFCTMEAMKCPDGSFVGRDPNNNCSFFPCNTTTNNTSVNNSGTSTSNSQSQSQQHTQTESGFPGDDNTTQSNVTGFSESQLNSSCVYGTLLFNGYCACWSGAYGTNCEMGYQANCKNVIHNFWNPTTYSIDNCYLSDLDSDNNNRDFCMDWTNHPTCDSWGVVKPLNTLNPPKMDSASFDGGNLSISISQSMVNGRADGAVYLNDLNLNSSHPYCIYPLSDYIQKSVDGCKDIWDFSLPWSLASQCGWKIVDTEGYRNYKGQVVVQNHEYVENIQECRIIQSVLRIKITFQLFVQLNLSSATYNQPNLNSAITRQIVSIQAGQPACLQLTTTLNYPYELSNGELVSTPEGKFLNHTFSRSFESCSGKDICLQRWTTCLNLANGTCDLDGSYSMNFTKICRSNDIQCPQSQSESAVIDFTLTSENFCAQISIDIGIIGNIKSYSDSTFLTQQTSFELGQKACYLITVNSDSNPSPYNPKTASIILSSTQLTLVTIRVGNSIVRIYSSTNSSNGLDTNLQTIKQSQGNLVGFCFTYSETLINNLNLTGTVTVNIGTEIAVNYQDGTSTNSNGSKRVVLESGQDTSSIGSTSTVTITTYHNDGSIIFLSICFALIVLFI